MINAVFLYSYTSSNYLHTCVASLIVMTLFFLSLFVIIQFVVFGTCILLLTYNQQL